MSFDLSTAIPVREREDGLLEKDTFDLSSARPVENSSILQKVMSNPIAQKTIDVVTGGLTLEEAQSSMEGLVGPLADIAPILTEGGFMPTPEKVAKGTVKLAQFVLSAMGRPVSGAQAGIGAIIDKKPATGILQSMFRGYMKPEEVASLTSRIPFKEFEQGSWMALVPRATLEAVETYAISTLVYGNVAGKIKDAYKSAKLAGVQAQVDDITTKMANTIVKDPAKYKVKFPSDFTPEDQFKYTKALLSNRLQASPKFGTVAMEKQSFVNKLKATLTSERGSVPIPKVGSTVEWKGEIGKIKEITGERVVIQLGKSEVVATLGQLSLPEVKPVGKVEQGLEDIKPSVLKTKDVKPLVRKITGQTKIGELVNETEALNRMLGQEEKLAGKLTKQSKKEEAKLLAGSMKQFFSYIKDIDKLEEQLKIEKFNTEADKVLAQQKVKVLKLVKALTKDIPENIAIEYRDMIEKIKDKFDFSRRSEKTMAAREGMREYIERMKVQGKPIDIPASELEMLDKTSLQDMTIDQLEEVKNEVDRLAQLGRTKQTAREAVYVAKKEKIKTELLKTVTPIKSKELTKLPIGEKHNAWVEKAIQLQNAAQKTGVGLTPIEGLADITGMQPMKKTIDEDFGKYLTYNDDSIKEWYKLTKDFTEKNFERIGAVAAARQEGGLERLANSGITEKEVNALKLTPEEEKAYKFVVETFDKSFPDVKQYMKEVYNQDVGEVENYVSFFSDYDLMSDLEIYERFGQTPEQIASRKTKTVEKGFTEQRTAQSNIKLQTNIDKIFRRHIDDVAYMLNTGKNIKMYFEIVNSPEMREKLGDVGTLAWLQYLDLMARKGGTEGAKRIAALDLLRKNIGAGVLSFRLSSALVQFSSFADTIATIGVDWATRGATAITSPEWRNFIMDNFPEIKKAVGDDIAFREFGEGAMAKLANAGLKPLQFLDGLMRSTAAAGAYQKLALEKGILVDFKNPNSELIAEATKLMRQSQGSSFFKDQPLAITAGYGLTDNRSVNKLLLTFQSFMLNRWDNINRQIWRMGVKEKNYGKAISSTFWLLIFAGAVEEGIRRGTRKITTTQGKEDGFVKGSLLNMLQSVPLVGQIASAIAYSSNPIPLIKTIDDLLGGLGSMAKGKAAETKLRGGIRTLGAAGSLAGLAGSSQAAQIIRDRIPSAKSKKQRSYW